MSMIYIECGGGRRDGRHSGITPAVPHMEKEMKLLTDCIADGS